MSIFEQFKNKTISYESILEQINNGIDITIEDENESTLLDLFLSEYCLLKDRYPNYLDIIKLLVSNGVTFSFQLIYHCDVIETTKVIVESIPNFKTEYSNNLLFFITSMEEIPFQMKVEIYTMFIINGYDVNDKYKNKNKYSILEFLVRSYDNDKDYDLKPLFDLLTEYDFKTEPILESVFCRLCNFYNGDNLLDLLEIAMIDDISETDRDYDDIITILLNINTSTKIVDIIRFVFSKGFRYNPEKIFLALIQTQSIHIKEIICVLDELNFDFNFINHSNRSNAFTCLFNELTCFRNDYISFKEIIKFLLDKGADINFQGTLGYTPLMLFVKYSERSYINENLLFLLECDVDVNLKNDEGKTCFEITNDHGESALIQELYSSSLSSFVLK